MVLLLLNKQEKKWDIITAEDKGNLSEEEQEQVLNLPKRFIGCLNHYKNQIQNENNDVVIIIVGDEGSGKSSLQGNILEYISDGRFDPQKDLIGADYIDGLNKIQNVKRRGWLGFDEGNSFFLATETVKREHRDLHKIFSIFRQKNLFVSICLPSFFRLGSYFAVDRSDGLLRTYLKKGKKGLFVYHGNKSKNKLYRIGKKTYNHLMVRPEIRSKFYKCPKLETEEYKKFKAVTLDIEIRKAVEKSKPPKTENDIKVEQRLQIIRANIEEPTANVAKILGITERRVQQLKKQINEEISLK